ncbi:hypothetical protein GCM10027275_44620 [Rhabdobacter roseus]|uniref:Transcriptional regulator with XRE-family HTH domain n=1 Tax=Rhabdobacter roseus TaxID=1655419 RepID=A0A840TRF0_9BACT|nr:helix-turn-helix transcriptional regulator [Rhabdobacter roseus]MBB5286481.1 transcriptional regulator with XRE-family HTH domain [Rhabdobacter roseus]
MPLPTQLKALRKKHQLSQTVLAEKLGITQGTYSAWESGKTSPSAALLVKIAQLYHISISELVSLEIEQSIVAPEEKTSALDAIRKVYEELIASQRHYCQQLETENQQLRRALGQKQISH